MPNDNVLLTDGDLRITLSVLRSLGKMNLQTVVSAENEKALSFFSRYCKKRLLYPSPKENRVGFVCAIEKIVKKSNFQVLMPISDWAIFPLSENRQKLTPYVKFPFPEHENVVRAFDKSLTLKVAIKEEIPTPKTFFVNSLQELTRIAKEVQFPAVVKPRWSWFWKGEKAAFSRPRYVNSAHELLSVYKAVHQQFPFPLVQEYVPGSNYSVAALCQNARLKAVCGIKVYRATPVAGGNSTYRESVQLAPKMKNYAERLLEALGWHGVAEVEFKLDPRDGLYKLMEVNGRFWGSLEVAIASEVDFPYLLYRLSLDEDIKPTFNYKVGVKCRWLEGDIAHLLESFKVIAWTTSIHYQSRWNTLLNFLKIYERGMKYDTFLRDDPIPFLWALCKRLLKVPTPSNTTSL